jgi:2-iminobutanoate/2-iminopropanoate deaminase
MRKSAMILVFTFITIMPAWAQTKQTKQMEKRIINPWQWQDKLSYAQAIEVTNAAGTLYCSGQAAMDADGKASSADMKTQLVQALQNLERVISEAGYEPKNIVRLNIFTTSEEELFACFDVFQDWIAKHGIKQATTLLGVKSLYETLKIEFEATVVK